MECSLFVTLIGAKVEYPKDYIPKDIYDEILVMWEIHYRLVGSCGRYVSRFFYLSRGVNV